MYAKKMRKEKEKLVRSRVYNKVWKRQKKERNRGREKSTANAKLKIRMKYISMYIYIWYGMWKAKFLKQHTAFNDIIINIFVDKTRLVAAWLKIKYSTY